MLCAKLATRRDGFKFPCGQCANCRINKRREWQARLLLEAASHAYGSFVTLTFADFGCPSVLRKVDAKAFIKKLSVLYPDLRYYLIGEYGTLTGRAHFHVHLFTSVPVLDSALRDCWTVGRIHVGDTEPASLDYVLGYLLKGTKVIRWPVEKQFPEFRMFSKGMGKLALPHLLIDGTELPREFKVFSRTWPIGRYLRDRAKKMGYTVSETSTKKLEALEARALSSLLIREDATPEEIEKLYADFWEQRNAKAKVLQQKAIRAAYLQEHGHVKKGNANETF